MTMSEKPFREFFLFGAIHDSDTGGGADFIGTYSTLEIARKKGNAIIRAQGGWVHIYRFDGQNLYPVIQREETTEWDEYCGGMVRY